MIKASPSTRNLMNKALQATLAIALAGAIAPPVASSPEAWAEAREQGSGAEPLQTIDSHNDTSTGEKGSADELAEEPASERDASALPDRNNLGEPAAAGNANEAIDDIRPQAVTPAAVSTAAVTGHATIRITGTLMASNGSTTSRSATIGTTWGSLTGETGKAFSAFSCAVASNNPGGGVSCATNNASGWKTQFRAWLTGNMALAYDIEYNVHGKDQPATQKSASNGGWISHNNAAIDGVGMYLKPKSYTHAIQARFQQPDGSWSGYSLQRSGTYAYLAAVPAWQRQADPTYRAVSTPAYVASFAAKTQSVDVYRQQYDVSFDSREGSDCSDSARTLLCGAALGELPVPTREGFSFEGWYTDPENGERVDADTAMPAADTTYYAHWAYGISYDPNGGEGYQAESEVQIQGDGYSLAPRASFTRPGYQFVEWNTRADGMGASYRVDEELPGYDEFDDAENRVLFAQWEPLQIRFSVPSRIACTLEADGTVHGPADGEAALSNESDIGIGVKGIKVRGTQGSRLVESPSQAGEFSLSMTPHDGNPISLGAYASDDFKPPAVPGDWIIPAGTQLALEGIEGKSAGTDAVSGGEATVGSVGWLMGMRTITVSYRDANGMAAQRVNAELPFALPRPPDQEGRTFAGWRKQEGDSSTVLNDGDYASFDSDTELVALWR